MTHLTTDELVDAVEETLAVERHAHLTSCGHCRQQQTQLAAMLRDVRNVEAPEPSPLFWDHFSENVRRTIATDGPAPPRLARWFQWPVLVPLAGLAVLILALVSAVPQGSSDLQRVRLAFNDARTPELDPAANAEGHWEMMAVLVGDVDVEAAEAAGITGTPGTADLVVSTLTSAEREELVRLVREELKGSGG